MFWRRSLAVVALVGLGAGIGYLYAQDRGGPGKLTAQDRLDIQELYWRYAHGHDFRDAELVASAFAEDGVFQVSPTRATVGRKEIFESLSAGFAGRGADSGRRHWQNAWRITPTPEGARGRVYWFALEVGTGDPIDGLPVDGHRGPSFRSTGYYEDVYVKTAEGWRFKSRTLNWDEAS
ncbi:MAG: nuclear transport factor 2 family protein [Acidobacteria bacterium]|nr:nuclear transport factor 2 family protein [Acidobacteriota bacterium]